MYPDDKRPRILGLAIRQMKVRGRVVFAFCFGARHAAVGRTRTPARQTGGRLPEKAALLPHKKARRPTARR